MQAKYRPRFRVPASWLDGSASQEPVAIPFLDEDEATMAIAATNAVLRQAKLAPMQLRRVSVSSRTGTGLAATIATTLGIPAERVEEGAAILYGQTHVGTPGEGPVLHIQAEAPRPGRAKPSGVAEGAFATARVSGHGVSDDGVLELADAPVTLDRETFDRLALWEQEAPRRTTMGAYIPSNTWQRGAGARFRLEASACSDGHVDFPARGRCSACGKTSAPKGLPHDGTVETYTVVAKGAGPSEYDPWQAVAGDYVVVVARFGPCRVPGLWTDGSVAQARIGAGVEPVFRRLFGQDGEWRYGLKFRPLGGAKS